MKGLGYALVILLGIGCWLIWQVVRRASAGAQAIINPERYAIEKVVELQRYNDVAVSIAEPKTSSSEKWDALVRFDPEIAAAAEKLRPYGDTWIEELRRGYFALQEDRAYLPSIVAKLVVEAEVEVKKAIEKRWAQKFQRTQYGELYTEQSLKILRRAEESGIKIKVQESGTLIIEEKKGTTYLYSNDQIRRFGHFNKLLD